MTEPRRLMAILAHPDDESLGFGGTLAHYAADGVEIALVVATRGQHGWQGDPEDNPGPAALGQLREGELRAATEVLGLAELHILDYMDGELDQADPDAVCADLIERIERFKPQVVISFGPDGSYGHPDHIAISQLALRAVYTAASQGGHQVSKMYYRVWNEAQQARYIAIFGDIQMPVDGVPRRFFGWEPWILTTQIDARQYLDRIWSAICCHKSQVFVYGELSVEQQQDIWGREGYYRALSTVNSGRELETDLFAGLPDASAETPAAPE
jgi:LmbE family N-acetylglucosaminyl deacetylase